MNRWDCDHPECKRYVTGCGGAVGLRAVGWYVGFGETSCGPLIFCPVHRPDGIPCDESDERSCAVCAADKAAEAIQGGIYTEADRATLDALKDQLIIQLGV